MALLVAHKGEEHGRVEFALFGVSFVAPAGLLSTRIDGRGRGDARLLLGLGPRPFAAGLGRADGLVLVLLVVLPLQLPPATARRFWGTVRARP